MGKHIGFQEAQEALFGALGRLGERIVLRDAKGRGRLDLRTFEQLSDNLLIVRPSSRFGEYRFQFYGATVTEVSPRGELSQTAFHDLFDDPFYRSALRAYRHVTMTGLPHVTRDHPLAGSGPRYFTRLLIPIFSNNRVDLIIGAMLPHDDAFAAPAPERAERPTPQDPPPRCPPPPPPPSPPSRVISFAAYR